MLDAEGLCGGGGGARGEKSQRPPLPQAIPPICNPELSTLLMLCIYCFWMALVVGAMPTLPATFRSPTALLE